MDLVFTLEKSTSMTLHNWSKSPLHVAAGLARIGGGECRAQKTTTIAPGEEADVPDPVTPLGLEFGSTGMMVRVWQNND